MVPQENAPREGGVDAGAENIMKPVLQPGLGIQLPSGSSNPSTTAATSTPGASSPDVQSTRSSFEIPRSRSRDVGSPAPGARGTAAPGTDEPRDLVVQSFAPRVSVYTSPDADELIRLKGLYGGLCRLLQPFGEAVQGNVVIRDSIGSSKSWHDFRICFTEFDRSTGYMPSTQRHTGVSASVASSVQSQSLDGGGDSSRAAATEEARQRASMLNDVVAGSIAASNRRAESGGDTEENGEDDNSPTTPHFRHFLRGLLADHSMVPHESFTHPVACVIAITSQNTSPIETLRDLYNDTRQESDNTPSWMGNDFLRYYVLIHDEDSDDISKSTALFNQMKRHFGLHTHLLRLRGVQCAREDDEAMAVPACTWLSAEEELMEQRQNGGDLIEFDDEFQPFVYTSDALALRTFVREMVTQSVIPYMESRVATWNDQVASRRRGISGRFMSLSKRWGGFGGGKKTEAISSKSNYAPALGGYPAESNESQMQRLADYALMLRDWRLAAATYDMLRSDFGDDKAWAHHAVANELMAVSLLLGGSARGARVDTLDACIDTATYSYITRCGDPFGALRCLVVVIELFRSRGGPAIEEAAKWSYRLLDLALLPPLLQGIAAERLAVAYTAQPGAGVARFGSRHRKTALWHLLGAAAWLAVREPRHARSQLDASRHTYSSFAGQDADAAMSFDGMQSYLVALQDDIAHQANMGGAHRPTPLDLEVSVVDEETKAFDDDTAPLSSNPTTRAKRFSISQPVPPSPGAELLLQMQLSEGQNKEADGFT